MLQKNIAKKHNKIKLYVDEYFDENNEKQLLMGTSKKDLNWFRSHQCDEHNPIRKIDYSAIREIEIPKLFPGKYSKF